MKKQDMNILLAYKNEQKRKANKMSPMQVYTIVLVGAILIVGAFALKFFIDNMNVKSEIATIELYINDPVNIQRMEKISKLQSDIKQLDEIAIEATTLKDVLAYKPRYDSKILDIVYYEKPSTLKITNIDFGANTLVLDYTAKFVSDVSNYALRLQRTYSFADVSYAGYTYNDNGTYGGTISLVMKGGK